jgi:hypothetical protein
MVDLLLEVVVLTVYTLALVFAVFITLKFIEVMFNRVRMMKFRKDDSD